METLTFLSTQHLVPEVVAQSADRQGKSASGADVAQIAPFDVDSWNRPIPGSWDDLNVAFSPW
jgi:hypothetical protein